MASSSERAAKIQAASSGKGGGANAILVAGVVAVLAIVAVVGGVIWASQKDSGGDGGPPPGTQMGQPFNPYPDATPADGAPTVDVYEDFRCPTCATFEQAFGESIDRLAQEGKITLRVHLKTVIDTQDRSDSSRVAGSSALCAAEEGAWKPFHSELFASQPPGHGELTPEVLRAAAEKAGLSGEKLSSWEECSTDERYADYVKSVDDASAEAGVNATPALAVNGTRVSWGEYATQDGQPDVAAFEAMLESGDVPDEKVATS